jgi:hypothetical protein
MATSSLATARTWVAETGDTVLNSIGVTATTTELNVLDGITASTAELNVLDGITASTAELNYTDGVTSSIQTQLNNKQPLDAELTAIAALATTDGNIIVGNGSTWVAESGATARTSLGLGSIATQNSNSVTITGGSISGITDIAVADGGTGASTAANARTNLGVAIGTDVQAWDANLDQIAALTPTDGNFIVGNGSAWVAETGNTVLSSIGVTATAAELNTLDGITATTAELNFTDGVTSNIQTQLDNKQPLDADLTAIGALAKTDGNFIVGNGSTWIVESGNTVLQSIGVTATTTELNVLDGITASTAELNILDGVTASATELNYTTGVTSGIQTQLDALDTGKAPLASPTFTNDVTISDTAPELVFVDTNGSSGLSQTALVQDANKLQFETRDSSGVFVGRDYVIEKASSGAQTHIFYLNDTERVRFAATGAIGLNGENYGTSGQVLTSAGIAAPPSWQTLASEQVTTAYAGASARAVGTYTTAWYALAGTLDDGSGSSIAVGTTIAGSSLRVPTSSTLSDNVNVDLYPDSFSAIAGSGSNFNTANTVTLSGTWRVMTSGKYKDRNESYYSFYPHLWLRIS